MKFSAVKGSVFCTTTSIQVGNHPQIFYRFLIYFCFTTVGSTCGKVSTQESIQSIADSINWVHQETPASKVSIVLENMCRQGNTIGGDLAELAEIIQLVYNRSRVGVCLDTCHALAAGYDIASEEGFEAFIEEFERVVGFRYLVAVHLNDSEGTSDVHFS